MRRKDDPLSIAATLIALSFAVVAFAQTETSARSKSDAGVVKARVVEVAPKLSATAMVTSVPELSINSRAEGELADVHLLPGTPVKAGDLLARLSGPARAVAIQKARGDVDRATANLKLARDLVEGMGKTPEGLVTTAQRQTAQSGATTAAIDLDSAKSALDLLISRGEIRAPADGVITAALASAGQHVAVEAPIAKLQPKTTLWLEASFWGEDARELSAGMRGIFTPGDGSSPVGIELSRIIAAQRLDGSVLADFSVYSSKASTRPANPTLRLGESGTLILSGKSRRVVEVPTTALVMSAGKWWVAVASGNDEKPRQIDISEEDGPYTVVRSGLSAGESVVVADAYLHFNRDFTKQYQHSD